MSVPDDQRPRIVDLCCGAGGCTRGYQEAGCHVTGVDVLPMPNYCGDEFVHADAVEWLRAAIDNGTIYDFDAIVASPPCPLHSSLNGWSGDSTAPELIEPIRDLMLEAGLPYVIENVEGAPLREPVRICGQALGLRVRRHRLFECSFPVMAHACQHPEPPVIVVGGSIGRKVFDPRRKAIAPSFDEAREVMGVEWMQTRKEVVNAIPPAYTRHVGLYLLAELKAVARV